MVKGYRMGFRVLTSVGHDGLRNVQVEVAKVRNARVRHMLPGSCHDQGVIQRIILLISSPCPNRKFPTPEFMHQKEIN